MKPSEEKPGLFDSEKNIQRVLYLLYGGCAVLLVIEILYRRHSYHPWENLLAFYPLYGFLGCVVLVLIAKWMRRFLMRDEAYYDRLEQSADDRKYGGGAK
ncbi:MAG TPA: hypothetical protein DIW43_06620 [Spongiibacteraceae bacterium]|nr:hypothetical protein [Spongiibacteraceae bacterium]HCS27108.1 hypothetical protein [Spongiibacteraceae bacterium]|tara:strand:+ start:45 stop:344 length:300 start_codon:yes stop_codon:yes gene_type:complete